MPVWLRQRLQMGYLFPYGGLVFPLLPSVLA